MPLLGVATRIFRKHADTAYWAVREWIGQVLSSLQEGISGVRIIQAYGDEKTQIDRSEDVNQSHLDANLRSAKNIAIYFPFIEITRVTSIATVIWFGAQRIFEGTFEQMNHSLEKLTSLPSKTEIYCAHEYTLSNLKFALLAEPKNLNLKEYQLNSTDKRKSNIPTIPTTLGRELQINPFLRVAETSLREAISDKLDHSNITSNAEVFGFLRSWKDSL